MTNKRAFEIVLALARAANFDGYVVGNNGTLKDNDEAIALMTTFEGDDMWPVSADCSHNNISIKGSEESLTITSARCNDCGVALTRKVVNGSFEYEEAK